MWAPPAVVPKAAYPFLDGYLQSSGTGVCEQGSALLGRGLCPLSRECSAPVSESTTSPERLSEQSSAWPQLPQQNALQFVSIQPPCTLQCVTCRSAGSPFPSTGTVKTEQNSAQRHWADAEPMSETNPGRIPSSFLLGGFSPDPEDFRVMRSFG